MRQNIELANMNIKAEEEVTGNIMDKQWNTYHFRKGIKWILLACYSA